MKTIKELRKVTNMSQTEFSNYLHIPVRDIQNWEQGVRIPPDYVVNLIKRVLENDNYDVDNNFYIFRSNIQHKIKNNSQKAILDILNSNEIDIYYERKDYLKCLYLLSCLDTLCIELNLPLCEEYDKYRQLKCKNAIYISTINKKKDMQTVYLEEFLKHNIYEVSIYDIC